MPPVQSSKAPRPRTIALVSLAILITCPLLAFLLVMAIEARTNQAMGRTIPGHVYEIDITAATYAQAIERWNNTYDIHLEADWPALIAAGIDPDSPIPPPPKLEHRPYWHVRTGPIGSSVIVSPNPVGALSAFTDTMGRVTWVVQLNRIILTTPQRQKELNDADWTFQARIKWNNLMRWTRFL